MILLQINLKLKILNFLENLMKCMKFCNITKFNP